jgi:hypothetical protein
MTNPTKNEVTTYVKLLSAAREQGLDAEFDVLMWIAEQRGRARQKERDQPNETAQLMYSDEELMRLGRAVLMRGGGAKS